MIGVPFFDPLPFNKLPPALRDEKEKDLEYYRQSMQAIVSKWWNNSLLLNNNSSNQFYFKHYQYYFGEQDNGLFRYLTQAAPDINLPAVYIPGQQIKQYIDYMVGNVIKQIDNYNMIATSLNPEMRKHLAELYQMATVEMELRPLMQKAESLTGMPTQPIQGFLPQRPEDIKRLQEKATLDAEDTARIMAENDFMVNHGQENLRRVFFDALMVGRGTQYLNIQNKKTVWTFVPAPYAIVDLAPFSDINRKASYGGHVLLLTVQEVIEKYNLDPNDIIELKKISQDSTLMNTMNQNSMWGNTLWWWDVFSATPKVLVANVEWKDILYDKKVASTKKGKPQFDNWNDFMRLSQTQKSYRIKKTVYSKPRTIIRQAVCIAGKFYTECGIKNNQVGYENMGENEIGYRNFTPSLMFGKNVSICQRLEPLQSERDIYAYLIRLCAARDKGKVLMYNKALMPTQYNGDIDNVIVKMATQGVVEYDSSRLEDSSQLAGVGKFFYVNDLGMKVTDVQAYQIMIDRLDREMQQIVSIPAIALGQQTSTEGKSVQENTVAYSTIPQEWMYKSFTEYVDSVLQYSMNLSKMAYLMDGSYEGNFVLNNKQITFLKIAKDFLWEDFTIRIKSDDIIDERAKLSLDAQAQAWAQNQTIDPLDSLRVQMAKTYKDAEAVLEEALIRKQQERQQSQQFEAQQQQAELGAKMQASQVIPQTNLQIAALQEQGKNMRQNDQTKAKTLDTVINHISDAHHRDHEANINVLQSLIDGELQKQQDERTNQQQNFVPLK